MTAILYDVTVVVLRVTFVGLYGLFCWECWPVGRWVGDRIGAWIIRGPE
jgi:hypothetical protein